MSNSNGTNGNAARTAMAPLEQTLRRRRILLTGATGFLGKVFLSLLLRWHPEVERVYLLIRGDRRLALSRLRREILDSPVFGPLREHLGDRFDRYVDEKLTVLCGDITEDDLVSEGEAPGRGEIDAVVHCAGLVNFEASLEKSLSVNTTGVAHVIEFCRKRGAALLHVSTCYAAGNADGHRFEDDTPVDWCPNGRRNFTLRREIRDALAAVARVEAESHDQVRQADELHVVNADSDGGDAHEAAAQRWRKRWVEERLKEIGLERARRWGWPNTYSYSKSLGEQLVFAAQDSIAATVARPSIIESALRDPFPGWNQGVNTSAPLTYLSGRGYRFYPAKGELVLDIIPVDLAAHAMIPILAALLAGRHKPIYQLCTSDVNPLPMRRLVELTGLSNRREHRRVRRPDGPLRAASGGGSGFAKHLRAREPDAARVAQERRRGRAHLVRRGFRTREKVRARRREVRRQYRDGARAGRSLSPLHPGAGLHFPRHQHSRALQVARGGRCRTSSVRARARSIGRTTGSTCICRDCAGTSSARSIFTRAGVPRLRRVIVR